jgi:Transposase
MDALEFAGYVGIDWSDREHAICLRAGDSEKIEASVISQKPEAIDEWARSLLQRFAGKPIAVELEQNKGPLIHALMKYSMFVLFPINPQSLAKYRQAFTLSRAKDDPTDAALALEILCKHRDQLRSLRPGDPHTRALAQATEYRRCLVDDRVRLSNRIVSLLKGYFPQAVDWLGHRDTTLFCDFLITWPTLAKLQRVRARPWSSSSTATTYVR